MPETSGTTGGSEVKATLKRPASVYTDQPSTSALKRPKNAEAVNPVPELAEDIKKLFEVIKETPEWEKLADIKWHSFILESTDQIAYEEFQLMYPCRHKDGTTHNNTETIPEVAVPKNNRITGALNNAVCHPMSAFKMRYAMSEMLNKKHNNYCGKNLMSWISKSRVNKVAVMEHRGGCYKESTNWHYHILLGHDNEIVNNCNFIKEATANKFAPWKLTKMVCNNPVQAMGYMAVPDPNRTYLGATDHNMNVIINTLGMELLGELELAMSITYPQGQATTDVELDPYTNLPLEGTKTVAAVAAVSNAFTLARSDVTYSKKEYANIKTGDQIQEMYDYIKPVILEDSSPEGMLCYLQETVLTRNHPNYQRHRNLIKDLQASQKMHLDSEVFTQYNQMIKQERINDVLDSFKVKNDTEETFKQFLNVREYWNEEYSRNLYPEEGLTQIPGWVVQNVHVQATILKYFGKLNTVRIHGKSNSGKTTIYSRGLTWPRRIIFETWDRSKHGMANLRWAHHLTIIDEADFAVGKDEMHDLKIIFEGGPDCKSVKVEPKFIGKMPVYPSPIILIGQQSQLRLDAITDPDDLEALRNRIKSFNQCPHPKGNEMFWQIMNALVAVGTKCIVENEPGIQFQDNYFYEQVYQWLLDLVNVDKTLKSFSLQAVSQSYPEIGNRYKGYFEPIEFASSSDATVEIPTANMPEQLCDYFL